MVRTVMVEGVLQVHEGRLVIADEAAVMRRGAAVVERLWKDLEAQGWFTPTER
jgi:5-methylthioadenosine/S-adenosylhomocysteine deaminase